MNERTLRILIAEDDPAHAEAIRRAFRTSRAFVELDFVKSLSEFRALAESRVPDLAIMDLNLPDGRAVEMLQPKPTLFPVLIMTSFGDEHVAVQAMKAGALDYIVKSAESFSNLPRLVDRALREWGLVCERKKAEARIVHLNSVLRGIRNVNQLITQGRERDSLLSEACCRLVETMGYATAWIALRENGGLRLAAHAGMPEPVAAGLRDQLAQGAVPPCVAGVERQAESEVLALPKSDCSTCEFDGLHSRCGVLVAKMAHLGVSYGVMVAAVPVEFVSDVEEHSLFLELVADMSFALYRLELERQHAVAEAELARSEARFRDLVENIEDVVFALDEEGSFLYVSPAVKRIYGYSPEELVGHPFTDLVHPEDLSRVLDSFRDALAGSVQPVTFRAIDKRGRTHHLRSTSRKREEAGKAVVNGVAIDITELHEALDAQRLSAERWQATFDAISDVVCVISADGRIVEVNRAGCTFLGFPRERILGRTCGDVARDTPFPFAEYLELARHSAGLASARHEAGGKTYDLILWPVVDPDGSRSGFVFVIEDVSGEIEANRERQRLEEQLNVVQRLEAVGRLAGGVAHDFNNLLSVILGNAAFAAEALHKADPVRADVLEIQTAAQRAANLTHQLLAFSRRQVLEPRVLNVNTVIAGVESLLRRLLGEHIDIEIRPSESLGAILADPGQVEQIVVNLAVNARDAMPQGGKLLIETTNVDVDASSVADQVAPGRYVLITVSDTGTGMDAETREHIFEPFFSTKETGKGTGLGLATVYGIVKQSGGDIRVASEVGSGATFRLYLPRIDASVRAEGQRSSLPAASGGGETVLIVEDEPAVCRIAVRILSKAGYHVLTASNGEEALDVRRKFDAPIHLLLTDVVMPRMSGRELAERLAEATPRLKVLYMSGYTDDAIVHHGVLESGMRFISKPFSSNELLGRVREALDEG
jgi:PAS domain S-box-containing protein